MTMRRLLMGLQTVLGVRRRGFFIPYRHADSLPPAGHTPLYGEIDKAMAAREAAFAELIGAIDGYADALLAIGDEAPPAPRWEQDWFPRLDAAAAYALVRTGQPRRIIEVGSGHSTRFLARAVRDAGYGCEITAIDPAPRAAITGLGVKTVNATIAQAGLSAFDDIEAGDIVFIDSSHILMPGSDVDDLLNRVLPRLPAGALVHVHDMFLPDDYPAAWGWRGYNEQSAVAAVVLTGAYEIVFASHYASTRMTAKLADTVLGRLPLVDGALETSLWLRKN